MKFFSYNLKPGKNYFPKPLILQLTLLNTNLIIFKSLLQKLSIKAKKTRKMYYF